LRQTGRGLCPARRDRQRRVGGADERSGRDNFAALPEIEAAGADVLVRWHRRFAGQRDFVVLAGQIFLQDYRCRACGEQGSGGHLNGLPLADFTRIGMPGSAFSDDLPGAGEIVRGNRITVHRRKVGGGLRAPRQQRLGQIATDGAFDVDMFGRQWPGKVEQASLGFFEWNRRDFCHQLRSAFPRSAFQCPDLPPRFSIKRISPITMPLSRALAMS